MQVEISTRHGTLERDQHEYLQTKAEKLLKYFSRLMSIEIAVKQLKHSWQVEILISAEHKHDFVAVEEGPTPESAMDQCSQKVEQQLRRYKERVQGPKGEPSLGGSLVPEIENEGPEKSPGHS